MNKFLFALVLCLSASIAAHAGLGLGESRTTTSCAESVSLNPSSSRDSYPQICYIVSVMRTEFGDQVEAYLTIDDFRYRVEENIDDYGRASLTLVSPAGYHVYKADIAKDGDRIRGIAFDIGGTAYNAWHFKSSQNFENED